MKKCPHSVVPCYYEPCQTGDHCELDAPRPSADRRNEVTDTPRTDACVPDEAECGNKLLLALCRRLERELVSAQQCAESRLEALVQEQEQRRASEKRLREQRDAALKDRDDAFVVVPKEPTEAMLNAGHIACYRDHNPDDGNLHKRIYKAMLAAAMSAKEGGAG